MIASTTQSKKTKAAGFPIEDHLRAQGEIEQCARELWRTGGCRPGSTLSDWLQAEREILERLRLRCEERRRAWPRFGGKKTQSAAADPEPQNPAGQRAERRHYTLNFS